MYAIPQQATRCRAAGQKSPLQLSSLHQHTTGAPGILCQKEKRRCLKEAGHASGDCCCFQDSFHTGFQTTPAFHAEKSLFLSSTSQRSKLNRGGREQAGNKKQGNGIILGEIILCYESSSRQLLLYVMWINTENIKEETFLTLSKHSRHLPSVSTCVPKLKWSTP